MMYGADSQNNGNARNNNWSFLVDITTPISRNDLLRTGPPVGVFVVVLCFSHIFIYRLCWFPPRVIRLGHQAQGNFRSCRLSVRRLMTFLKHITLHEFGFPFWLQILLRQPEHESTPTIHQLSLALKLLEELSAICSNEVSSVGR